MNLNTAKKTKKSLLRCGFTVSDKQNVFNSCLNCEALAECWVDCHAAND